MRRVHEQRGRRTRKNGNVVRGQLAPGAEVLAGLKPDVTARKFQAGDPTALLKNASIAFRLRLGDAVFIPAGTVHTIGPGLVLCEIQEHSDLTYRVYDYNRRDAKGPCSRAARREGSRGDSFRQTKWRQDSSLFASSAAA